MASRVGKTVWVRDPALADEQVFIKGKVLSEDTSQVRRRRCRALERTPKCVSAR